MKWAEDFSDLSCRVIGTQTITLSYVICGTVDVPRDAPALMPNQPYAAEYESVEEDMIACDTHTHPLYRDDNASLYFYLEESTCSTIYTSLIHPYS